MIKYGWFDHDYCGLALGYARNHQSRLSYVRCLICKRDIKVSSRGITTFLEHCLGLRHHRLGCIVRLYLGSALRRRDGTLMTMEVKPWGEDSQDDNWPERTVHLFVCLSGS